nr:WAS/WASL-interacting protein family member 2-like [Aegilops tauschii subsp. strangulata]
MAPTSSSLPWRRRPSSSTAGAPSPPLRRPEPGLVKPHRRLAALLGPDLAGFARLLASSPVARELAVAPFPDLHHPASRSAITASSLCLLASFLPRPHWRPTPAPLPRELPHRRHHASPPPRRLEPPLPPRQPAPLLPRPPSASTEQAPAPHDFVYAVSCSSPSHRRSKAGLLQPVVAGAPHHHHHASRASSLSPTPRARTPPRQ